MAYMNAFFNQELPVTEPRLIDLVGRALATTGSPVCIDTMIVIITLTVSR